MAITTSSCAEILAGNVIISQVEGTADDSESSNPQQGTVDAVGPEALSLPQVKAAQNEDAAPFFPTSSIKIPATRKDSRKLFVGGLPMDVTSQEFLTFFRQFGNVVDSVVMFDRETRKPRGFGFITFDDPEICRRLLSTGQMSTLDEDMQSEYSPMHESGRLYMRGKLIEIKAAQPKEPEQKAAPQSAFLPTKYYQYPSPQYDASYTFGAKYSATLPHANYSPNMYGFTVPPTPIHYSATPSTPVTPQAAMDMAHHMLFYSQLLATPTLISPMMSPMMSPMGMGYNHHYHNYSQEFQANRQHVDFSKEKNGVSEVSASTAPSVSDIKPDSLMTHNPVSSFRIGGATFYPEE